MSDDQDDVNPFARGAMSVVTAFAAGFACVLAVVVLLLLVESCSGR